MKQKLFEHFENKLSYSIGGDTNVQTIVLLPPGIGDSQYCAELNSRFQSYHRGNPRSAL